MKKVIGLTGSFQSGKQELAEVFRALGCVFLDLNTLAERVRVGDPTVRARYAEEGLSGGVMADGKRSLLYYQKVSHNPRLHERIMEVELPAVIRLTQEAIQQHTQVGILIINWGYLYRMLDAVPFDFVLVFQASREVWYERIRRRVIQGGWPADAPPTDDQILEFVQATEMEPGRVLGAVQEKCSDCHRVIDTSAEDWGEAQLRAEFLELSW